MIDNIHRFFCNQQKALFEWAARNGYDIKSFAREFLGSSFCRRSLDKPYSVDQFADELDWIDFMEIDGEFHPVMDESPFPVHIAGWLGFVYRQIQIETGLQSKTIVERVPPERLIVAYSGLHTVDEDMQVEIIRHDFGI